MIDVRCREHYDRVVAWAREAGLMDRLQKTLDYLADYGQGPTRCLVYHDFAPHSFLVTMQSLEDDVWVDWWHGGCIYHDREWGVHT